MERKRVLIVDDSALARKALAQLINEDPVLEVMDTAADPYIAAQKLKSSIPDVITLDIEMPRMDGITFLRTLMSQYPIPVVIISSLTQAGTETALQALRYGAVEIVSKPRLFGTGLDVADNKTRITEAIKGAACAVVSRRSALSRPPKPNSIPTKSQAQVVSHAESGSMVKTTENIVLMGASTGGTEALRTILSKLPAHAPAMACVLHMPEGFTKSFAESLDKCSHVHVKEAVDGDALVRGTVLIAPGNRHMIVRRSGARYFVRITKGPLVNRHRPSVDVLFSSAAEYVGKNAVGIILTGMGRDGAQGILKMKESGASTIAQDEQSSVVFGMPKEAILAGGIDRVLPLLAIPGVIA